jgi:hypothetical protein
MSASGTEPSDSQISCGIYVGWRLSDSGATGYFCGAKEAACGKGSLCVETKLYPVEPGQLTKQPMSTLVVVARRCGDDLDVKELCT